MTWNWKRWPWTKDDLLARTWPQMSLEDQTALVDAAIACLRAPGVAVKLGEAFRKVKEADNEQGGA